MTTYEKFETDIELAKSAVEFGDITLAHRHFHRAMGRIDEMTGTDEARARRITEKFYSEHLI